MKTKIFLLLLAVGAFCAVRPAQAHHHLGGHAAQAGVAAGVTVRLVEGVEAVEVDDDHRQRRALARGALPLRIEQRERVTAVCDAGQ